MWYNKNMIKIELDLISLQKARKKLGVSKALLYYYLRKGKLPYYYSIDGRFYLDDEIFELLKNKIKGNKNAERFEFDSGLVQT